NYAPGDEIYIFGFSRGAFTARSRGGLVGLAGLLTPPFLGGPLREVMEIYRRRDLKRDARRAGIDALRMGGRRVARIPDVGIRCIGVWDTVGSLGIPGDLGRRFLGGKHYFHDVMLGGNVDVALHAVAIDEKRSAFSPTLWVSADGRPSRNGQVVEQVWFAGAHSNVGGSYADSGLSDIAFDWMARRVDALTGLALVPGTIGAVDPQAAAQAHGVDSRTILYTDSRIYPYQRIIGRHVPDGDGFGEWFRRTFTRYDRRNIPPDGLKTINEALHVSVLKRWDCDGGVPHDCKAEGACARVPYRPVNLAAAIAAGPDPQRLPVIGWDGTPIGNPASVWPVAGA
ncbi:MAG: DUF2235 domain-containing protein, partial [Alphaproteobacteria bacterium]